MSLFKLLTKCATLVRVYGHWPTLEIPKQSLDEYARDLEEHTYTQSEDYREYIDFLKIVKNDLKVSITDLPECTRNWYAFLKWFLPQKGHTLPEDDDIISTMVKVTSMTSPIIEPTMPLPVVGKDEAPSSMLTLTIGKPNIGDKAVQAPTLMERVVSQPVVSSLQECSVSTSVTLPVFKVFDVTGTSTQLVTSSPLATTQAHKPIEKVSCSISKTLSSASTRIMTSKSPKDHTKTDDSTQATLDSGVALSNLWSLPLGSGKELKELTGQDLSTMSPSELVEAAVDYTRKHGNEMSLRAGVNTALPAIATPTRSMRTVASPVSYASSLSSKPGGSVFTSPKSSPGPASPVFCTTPKSCSDMEDAKEIQQK